MVIHAVSLLSAVFTSRCGTFDPSTQTHSLPVGPVNPLPGCWGLLGVIQIVGIGTSDIVR
jgi:hypothetical protein